MRFKFLITVASATFSLVSCKVDPHIVPALPADHLEQIIPENWPQPKYTFSANTISEDKFILGRALFYETKLSRDNSISCGSCHQIFAAFAQKDHDFSHGVPTAAGQEQVGVRNSPGLFNLAWHPLFMHDGAINHLEVQPLGPINNAIEMDENINNVLSKLKASEKYRELFKNAYGDEDVTSERMLKSMAQFMGLLLSNKSKYDQVKAGEKQFTEQEQKGYALFAQKCGSCHQEPLFSDFKFRNNGLEGNPLLKDEGRGHLFPQEPSLKYTFKTPSLRNIALTGPYMHDGRYATLEDCLNHYTNNIKNHTNLDPLLEYGIPMSAAEKQDIIVFLHTLTDFNFISDKRFKDPNTQ